jgi:thiamine-phosphate pyrophosphorylase
VASPATTYNRLAVLLYYITDRRAFAGTESEQRTTLLGRIAEAALAGVDYIQLREKDLPAFELEQLAREAVIAVRKNSATTKLLINSQTDIALAVGADGVHLPAGSPLPRSCRDFWLRNCDREPLIGVSAHSVDDVRQAEADGASFAVLAPIFEKATIDVKGIGLEVLRAACLRSSGQRHRFTVLALGGVTLSNAWACLDAGASGVAGIRLFQQGELAETVHQLRELATSR